MPDSANQVVFYDGVCGLCNRLVRFILKHDTRSYFRFASLQSDYATRILNPQGFDPQDLNTLYLVDAPSERILTRSDAVILVLRKLGSFWRAVSVALSLFPKPLRDWGYGVVARRRYRIFGQYETCPLPEKKYQDRFLEK
jgi:predicted DCC family thiol-disulfide oxidoreductase YuxK